ncbi:MAG: sugar phosphate nucleotidyltransferase [Oscillospiraceae bacterium]
MAYSDYIIDDSKSVAEALRALEHGWHKILFIAPDDMLRGVVTDGNIRRYLLAGGHIESPVSDAANYAPIVEEGFHEAHAREMLVEKDITCVPMIDKAGRLHALVFRDETLHRASNAIDTPVIMMAGGLGTRLRPYTEILPKPLIPVGGITITEHILNRFRKFGCTQFSLVVNYKKNLIKSYFSEVEAGNGLEFIDETDPLGTGGGLAFYKGRFDGPVFVTNCDSVVEADYGEILRFHNDTKSVITLVCAKKSFEIPYGVVTSSEDGEVVELLEKPRYNLLTNTGLYVVSPEFIEMVPNNRYTPITEIIGYCRELGKRVSAFPIEEECFIDIGQLEDLRSVEGKLK